MKNQDSLAILVSRHLCGLSECNELARGKACVSHKGAKNAKGKTRTGGVSLRLAGVKAGLLMNFNVTKIESGIKRFVLLRGKTILCLCESLVA